MDESAVLTAVKSPIQINKLVVSNRIAMAPMTRRAANGSCCATDDMARYYGTRSAHSCGLIITEGVHINTTTAVDAPNTTICRTPESIAAWKTVVDAVHSTGGKVAMQIWHTGHFSQKPVSPSGTQMGAIPPRVLTEDELDEIARDYAITCEAAVKGAGVDAVEIHGAHGYLLDSFVSPTYNTRSDAFGGSVEKRAEFPSRVVKMVRAAVGPDVAIIYRFSQWSLGNYDEIKFSDSNELRTFCGKLRESGVNCFHVSTRRLMDPGFPKEDEKRTLAGWTKLCSDGLPIIGVGSVSVNRAFARGGTDNFEVTDPTPCLELVARSEIDMVAVGRSMLSNPDWCSKVLSGNWRQLKAYDPADTSRLV